MSSGRKLNVLFQVDCICDDLQQRKDVKTLERFINMFASASVTAPGGSDNQVQIYFIAQKSLNVIGFRSVIKSHGLKITKTQQNKTARSVKSGLTHTSKNGNFRVLF